MEINFDFDKLSQVHHYLYNGINNTINTSIIKVSRYIYFIIIIIIIIIIILLI